MADDQEDAADPPLAVKVLIIGYSSDGAIHLHLVGANGKTLAIAPFNRELAAIFCEDFGKHIATLAVQDAIGETKGTA